MLMCVCVHVSVCVCVSVCVIFYRLIVIVLGHLGTVYNQVLLSFQHQPFSTPPSSHGILAVSVKMTDGMKEYTLSS